MPTRWPLIVLGVPVAIGATVFALGRRLPLEHRARRSLEVHRPPAVVWDALTDIDRYPLWRPGVHRVERLPDDAGRVCWREYASHGDIAYELVDATEPLRLVTAIADPRLPFGGTWTYEITPWPGGCTVCIVERGEIRNPFYRFVARYLTGYTAALERYLAALAVHLGAERRDTAERRRDART
ncbi:SRPBCC family protein [Kitasatospora sp. NPDC057015]|uniref:SRPBCC family protein n=1 Tax=Kitasatospora sp. NPDC057015 TaxID=3346001 RepID=UPI00362C1756